MYGIKDTKTIRALCSADYNFIFRKDTGFFARWGATKDDDPNWSPFGPEIADIEISSAAPEDLKQDSDLTAITQGGCNGIGCKKFCYKQNVGNRTVHMTLELFQQIMDRMPPTLTQIAFGVCSIDSNPDTWDIFEEARRRDVVPNVTVNGQGITNEVAAKLSSLCGAVAVSINPDNREIAYDAVKKLTQDYGMTQINFHIVLAQDTVSFVKSVVDDMQVDPRLSGLNALVMLAFKDRENTQCFQPVTLKGYADVIDYCEQKEVRFGFDSCSAHTYLRVIEGRPDHDQLAQCVEPCESGLFSIYINVFGQVSACSFCEGIDTWEHGIDILSYDSFIDLWKDSKMENWRQQLLARKRECPFYEIGK